MPKKWCSESGVMRFKPDYVLTPFKKKYLFAKHVLPRAWMQAHRWIVIFVVNGTSKRRLRRINIGHILRTLEFASTVKRSRNALQV